MDEKMRAAAVSVGSNATLVLSKIVIGIVTGSISIISEAAHSGVDLLASLIAFFSVREVRKPADREHPFGHGKVENISGSVEALLILFAAVFIIHEAVGKIMHGGEVEHVGLGVLVMGVATVVNIFVSTYLFKMAKKTDSLALEADAEHLRTDVYTSLGVMGALLLMEITGITLIDPIVAIIVAIYIGYIAIGLTRKAMQDLVDRRLSDEEEGFIREVLDTIPEVRGYHEIRTRRSGKDRFIDFHVLVPDTMDVKDSHEMTKRAEKAITEKLTNASVTIHVEPCSGRCGDCEDPCPEGTRKAERNGIIPGEEELKEEIFHILKEMEDVLGTDDIHIHRLSGKWEVHIDLIVPSGLTVMESHHTTVRVEEALRASRKDLGKVTIHVEHDGHTDPAC